MKCSFCGYEWKPKVLNPKACPSCKRYTKKEQAKLITKLVKASYKAGYAKAIADESRKGEA